MNAKVDSEAVLADIEGALKQTYDAVHVLREPQSPYTGVVACIDTATGKQRYAVAKLQDNNCQTFLTQPFTKGQVTLENIPLNETDVIDYVGQHEGIGKRIARELKEAITLRSPDDCDSSLSDLRQTLEFIARPSLSHSTMGNPRGADIAYLAKAVSRLLDRIEKLERASQQ